MERRKCIIGSRRLSIHREETWPVGEDRMGGEIGDALIRSDSTVTPAIKRTIVTREKQVLR